MNARIPAAMAAAVGLAMVAGCGDDASPAASSSSGSAVSGTITVLAAASLKESFTSLESAFEAAHPGTNVVLSFGPSSGLANQITQGAPADVFASASGKNMRQVVSAGDASDPTTFARNTMTIVTPPSNPAKISGISDLSRSGVKVAVCQAQVPCGTVAGKVFSQAKVTVRPVTQEEDVKAVLSKVTLGEVDAGVVYVTDAKAAGSKVKQIDIPANVNASTDYPIAVLKESKNAATAKAFVDFILSAKGADALAKAGFAAPQ